MKEKNNKNDILSLFPKELYNIVKNSPFELALNKSINIETRLEFLLPYLGVPTNLKGYNYLKFAILAVAEDETKIQKVTSNLYPQIANYYTTTSSRVERSIRHSLEICFKRINPIIANWLFGYSLDPITKKCTSSEFISRISRFLTKI